MEKIIICHPRTYKEIKLSKPQGTLCEARKTLDPGVKRRDDGWRVFDGMERFLPET